MRVLQISIGLAFILGFPLFSYADTLRSNNFHIDESFIGGGGDVQSSSTNFKSDSTIGDSVVGDTSTAAGRQLQAGYVTTSDPALTFSVNTSSINFGNLSTTVAATGTTTFSVTNYTSYGYVVQVSGQTPKTGTKNLTGLSTQTASATGTEQFGINLVANTSPVTVGASPSPSGTVGAAATGYDTANQYKYVSGDTVAQAAKSSAQTIYTISYLINTATTTAGGKYTGNLTLICTGTY